MAADLSIQIDDTTKIGYTKGASNLTLRSRLKLALLRRKGRVTYNWEGKNCTWQFKFSQPPIRMLPGIGGGVIDFANHDAYRQNEIDWRGYFGTDSISMLQKQVNRGAAALVNLFQTKQNDLMSSIRDNFCAELYKDGQAAGRLMAIHGLATFTGQGTVTAADKIAAPDGTYGKFATDIGTFNGSWTANLGTFNNASLATDWPDGSGTAEYDVTSPKLVNWSSTGWGTGSTLWEDNCWRVLSQTILWLTTTGGNDGMPDICTMPSHLLQGIKNHEEAIRRVLIPSPAALELGFKGTLNMDGVELAPDFDCPVNTFYMENLSQTEIRSLFPELFWIKGPDTDARTMWSTVWGTGFYGNVVHQPKHTAEGKNRA